MGNEKSWSDYNMMRKKRNFGKGEIQCRRCKTHRGVIRKYGLYYCRKCMREIAKDLGFRKYT